MKKTYAHRPGWLCLVIFILFPTLLLAQDRRSELLFDILKEKWHLPVSDEGRIHNGIPVGSRNEGEIRFTDNNDQFRSEGEPFIAVNPNDPNQIVVSFMELGFELDFPVYYSSDGGETWDRSSFSPIDTFKSDFPELFVAGGGDPVLAFDASGKLYFTWIYLGIQAMTGTIVTYWAWSDDQGAQFSFAEGKNRFIEYGSINLINAKILNEGNGIFDRPWLAVDRSGGPLDGTLYCTGLFLPSDSSRIAGEGLVARIKYPGVDSFALGQTQISISEEAQFSNVDVDQGGRVHVTFMDLDSSRLMHALLKAGGKEIISLDTIASATGFSPVKVHVRENPAPSLVVDPGDFNLFLAWGDFTSDQVSGYLSMSFDLGKTWSAKRPVSDLFKEPLDQVLMPVLAGNNAGHLVLTWYGLDSLDRGLYYIAQSADSGESWSEPVAVSADTTDFGLYDEFHFFGDYYKTAYVDETAYITWSDGRDSLGAKLYFAKVDPLNPAVRIIQVNHEADGIWVGNVFPSPGGAQTRIKIRSEKGVHAALRINTIDGRIIHQNSMRILPGEQLYAVPAVRQSGIYLLELIDDGRKFSRRFIRE